MKLSVEAKVAAAVAAGFIALTLGAIAQGNSVRQTGAANGYGPTNKSGADTHMSSQRDDNSLPGHTNATNNNGKKTRSVKSRKHDTQHARQSENSEPNKAGG